GLACGRAGLPRSSRYSRPALGRTHKMSEAISGEVLRVVRSFRRLELALVGRREGLGEQRFEQAAAGVVGGGEACFEPVAQGHQLMDLGDNAALFGEGWKGNGDRLQFLHTLYIGNCHSDRVRKNLLLKKW